MCINEHKTNKQKECRRNADVHHMSGRNKDGWGSHVRERRGSGGGHVPGRWCHSRPGAAAAPRRGGRERFPPCSTRWGEGWGNTQTSAGTNSLHTNKTTPLTPTLLSVVCIILSLNEIIHFVDVRKLKLCCCMMKSFISFTTAARVTSGVIHSHCSPLLPLTSWRAACRLEMK